MAYEVLSEDLYEGSSSSQPKRKKSRENSDHQNSSSFNPIYLHIAVIVIIILGLFFYFSSDFTFNFKNEPQRTTISLIGELSNFTYNFNSVNLNVYSSEFNLETQDGLFSDKSTDFKIDNFSGIIYLKNNSIIIEGSAQKLEYDKNMFQLKGKNFKLTSNKKTNTNIYFKDVALNFTNGRIKIDENLNYEFKNSSIILKDFNTSMSYDGTFSFSGHASEFSFFSPNQHLNIGYKE